MDKKNTVIGVGLLIAAFATLYIGNRFAPPPQAAPEIAPAQAPLPTAPNQANAAQQVVTSSPDNAQFAALAESNKDEVLTTLENDFVRVDFTNFGGAIADVAFKRYADKLDSPEPFLFNHPRVEPILAINDVPGIGADVAYQLVKSSATEMVFRTVLEGRLEVTRHYSLGTDTDGSDPYLVRHETVLRDLSGHGAPQTLAALSLGTASLVSANDYGRYLNVMAWDGEDETFTKPGELEGGGLLAKVGLKDGAPKSMITKPVQALWAGVENQFFVSLYTGDNPGVSTSARRVELEPFPGSSRPNQGITGVVTYALPAIDASGSAILGGDLYVGPKEYDRLRKFDQKQSKVMQFASNFYYKIFGTGVIAPLLNLTMVTLHGWVGSWGAAIILMTLGLKLISLPFTLAASRSAKRMAKLQPLMKEVKEKYKDNPQKQQEMTLKIFKDNKVNPMGGCLPVLITMPLFIAFFSMLYGTAELRFEPFLWVTDLSAPDTVWHFMGLPLNIMPLLMGATMIYQMRLTPTPTTDNAQMQMMKYMPIVFTLICYNFAAALALYSTINGLFTIAQQLIVNKTTKDVPLAMGAGSMAVSTATSAWNPNKNKGKKKK